MLTKYQPQTFEKKWREKWNEEKLYSYQLSVIRKRTTKKYYILVELPYTSGDLHIGHWFTFVTPDVLSRFKRMNNFNVFFPMGYDAFGLPAENAAIKRKIHPKDWTMKNIEMMTKQFQTMGTMIDWNWMTITCLPEYYRWNQWIFLKMYEKGIAYRGKTLSNWCEHDQTVLANENVENGHCWRCGSQMVQKEVEQWFLKITDYAEKLIWSEKSPIDWPMSVRVGQNNWIGRSEGMIIDFDGIEVFTTRPETVDGATFLVLAPEHRFVAKLLNSKIIPSDSGQKSKLEEIKKYVEQARKKTEEQRKIEARKKTGVFSGELATNPLTGKKIPIWIADYVIGSYGTGAVMGVPVADERDFEFAKTHHLPIIPTSFKSKPAGKKRIIYHLRDWSVSRQRYWGTPVPMIHCQKCGVVPVPEKDLPVELPYEVDFTPKGKPPLATNEKWLKVKCPRCGRAAKRDPETLDTFFDSSWYFLRYVSPNYDKGPFDKNLVRKLTPVDVYFGGAEHTLGHTLYARFFTKFFHDLGFLDYEEFALKRIQHGVVLGPDGDRMSKSKGNVINPDDVVSEYGSDTVRLYLCFMMPYEATSPWSTTTIAGVNRFLNRIWKIYQNYQINQKKSVEIGKNPISSDFRSLPNSSENEDKQLVSKLYKTINKVTNDIQNIKMNTAIAGMMEFLNEWEASTTASVRQAIGLSTEQAKQFLQILAPFAPFITEEIWHEVFGEKESIHLSKWPKFDPDLIGAGEEITIPVQVNGKLRATIKVESRKSKVENEIIKLALKDEKVKKYITGKEYKIIYVQGKIINFIIY